MSIHNKLDFGGEMFTDLHNRKCFYCGEIVGTLPHRAKGFVMWMGYMEEPEDEDIIVLHPKCAQTLAMHLIKDGLLAESGQEITRKGA